MLNLPRDLINFLKKNFKLNHAEILSVQKSSDKTVKYAIKLHDGLVIESVLIPSNDRITACVSSQVGCSLDCNFCATSQLKRMRNLEAYEIFDQIMILNKESINYFSSSISNIVFMGMGEPLLNYKNVIESIMNATFTPNSETTNPPENAPKHKAADHVALSSAFAVAKSSSLTIFGRAARSAVTYNPCNAIMIPEIVNIHHMSSGPLTPMNASANPIWNTLVTIINFLRLTRSARRPNNGCIRAKAPILTAIKIPSSNSESVYSSISKKRAIVLNHSPNMDTKAANQNRRYVRFVFTKRT